MIPNRRSIPPIIWHLNPCPVCGFLKMRRILFIFGPMVFRGGGEALLLLTSLNFLLPSFGCDLMSVVFPPGNLGLGEPWGRTTESEIARLTPSLDLTGQSQGTLSRHTDSQDTDISRHIVQLREVVNQLQEN